MPPLDDAELKDLVIQGNKTIEALRAEVEARKGADVVTTEKIGRMEADLAKILAQKSDDEIAKKALEDKIRDLETKAARPGAGGFKADAATDVEHKAAFLAWMREGEMRGAGVKLLDIQAKATDVQVATAASGGYALPKQLSAGILQQAVDISPIRALATVVQVSTPDYHDLIDLNGMGTEWLGETSTHNQTNTPSMAEVVPTFGELSAKPEATRQSITDLNFDVEAWLMGRAAMMFAQAEGLAFVSGNGTNKPTGFLAGPAPVTTGDASRAFGTLQYIATGQAAALATNPFDSTKSMIFSMRAMHRPGAAWVMNSLSQAALASVRDSQGRYLLKTDVAAGTPYTIEGYPVYVAEDMPNIAANAFPIAFGNFKDGYLIAHIPGSFWVQRDEITKPGYVRFPMSRRVGGKLRDTNAIKLLKIAAA